MNTASDAKPASAGTIRARALSYLVTFSSWVTMLVGWVWLVSWWFTREPVDIAVAASMMALSFSLMAYSAATKR